MITLSKYQKIQEDICQKQKKFSLPAKFNCDKHFVIAAMCKDAENDFIEYMYGDSLNVSFDHELSEYIGKEYSNADKILLSRSVDKVIDMFASCLLTKNTICSLRREIMKLFVFE